MPIARPHLGGRSPFHPPLLLFAALLVASCPLPGPGSLRVLVVDGADLPVAGVSIDIVGNNSGAITGPTGEAIFSALAAGTYTVRAIQFGTCISSATATVVQGTETQITIPMCIGDRVSVGNGGGQPALLLFDAAMGAGAPTCVSDEFRLGAGTIDMNGNALPPGTNSATGKPCHTSATIFNPARGLFFTANVTTLPWTAGSSDNIPITLGSRTRIGLSVWILGAGNGTVTTLAAAIKNVHLARASALLADAGLELVADETLGGTPTIVDVGTLANPTTLRAAVGNDCSQVPTIRTTPLVYDSGRINVYYVDAIGGQGTSQNGFVCFLEGREVIFMDSHTAFDHILAHELGHALGLVEPHWGHTHKLMDGFLQHADGTPRNVMGYGAAGTTPDPLYLSRGQMFRMNLSPWSWLNVVSPGNAKTPRQRQLGGSPAVVSCACQPARATANCPTLPLTELAQNHLSSAGPMPLACGVSLSSLNVSVCAGKKVSVTASFRSTPGGAAVPAVSKDSFWRSGDPSVADVVQSAQNFHPVNGGSSTGTITGVKVGSTFADVFVGGPTATAQVAVTVTAAGGGCP